MVQGTALWGDIPWIIHDPELVQLVEPLLVLHKQLVLNSRAHVEGRLPVLRLLLAGGHRMHIAANLILELPLLGGRHVVGVLLVNQFNYFLHLVLNVLAGGGLRVLLVLIGRRHVHLLRVLVPARLVLVQSDHREFLLYQVWHRPRVPIRNTLRRLHVLRL